LESEAARRDAELGAVEDAAASLAPELQALAEQEARLAADRQRFDTDWGDGVAPPSGRAAEVRGELAALTAAIERGENELAKIDHTLADLAGRAERLDREAAELRDQLARAAAAEEPIVARLDDAERARVAADERVAALTAARAEADGE